jgi:EAL domain-containing protein (putative c-di-GMP-specific phosphodiesterase class I)
VEQSRRNPTGLVRGQSDQHVAQVLAWVKPVEFGDLDQATTFLTRTATLEAARVHGFPLDHIIFEVTEGERIEDGPWFASILREYKRCGFKTAIDDFGAGYAGLKLLSDFQPDLVKVDMDLIRGVDGNPARQAIVRSLVSLCREMSITLIAEGVETKSERDFLFDQGIELMQGYLFAHPAFRSIAALKPGAY